MFPGLEMAREMCARGHCVVVWLSGREAERGVQGVWNGRTEVVAARSFAGGGVVRALAGALCMLWSSVRCHQRMRSDRPDVLLAMGSYTSVGPVLAARRLGVPIVLHEANAVPGRAISFLARFATLVALSYKIAGESLAERNTVLTGLPIRAVSPGRFEDVLFDKETFTLLVTGGSQGAQRLNEICCEAVCRVHSQGLPIQVVHLSGVRDRGGVEDRYRSAGVRHVVLGFLEDMGKAYNAADFAVTRAGAATCAELVAYGVPSLLVPLPNAVRGHQQANAVQTSAYSGVDWWAQSDLTVSRLSEYLGEMIKSPERVDEMKIALRSVEMGNAASLLAAVVLEKPSVTTLFIPLRSLPPPSTTTGSSLLAMSRLASFG